MCQCEDASLTKVVGYVYISIIATVKVINVAVTSRLGISFITFAVYNVSIVDMVAVETL